MSTSPGFGVYVHWPFCAQKCPYCDFNSHVRHGGWDEGKYLAAYLMELRTAAATLAAPQASTAGPPACASPPPRGEGLGVREQSDALSARTYPTPDPSPSRGGEQWLRLHSKASHTIEQGHRPVTSVFFGGGTPSLMQPETVAAIIDAIRANFGLTPDCEITLEGNPGSVEAGRFRDYRAAGVNRVSLGLQALDDEQLKRLGRIHTVAEALAALDIARTTFDRVSFDLIYARPGMAEAIWRSELARALTLQAGHLSLYQLTIEDGTPYAALHRAGKLIVPEPETADRLYAVTQEMCEAAGLPAYEISNHARPGDESRHNLVYWRYGHYLGLGPGAHGREPRIEGRVATVNERGPEAWMARVVETGRGLVEAQVLSRSEQADEMLLMGLRLAEGLDLARLEAVGGVMPSKAVLSRLESLGMIEGLSPDRIRATRAGRFVLNEVVRQLALSLVPVP